MHRPITAALLILALTGLAAPEVRSETCAADHLSRVRGGDECLVIKTFGTPSATGTTLAVFIHGDGSSGGPSDYLYERAERFAADGVVAVALIRPGYFDAAGNESTGESFRRNGDGYQPAVVDAVAAAVKSLKEFYSAKKVVLVGHSGGAAISGVILGRFPGLADAAVLAACPCNVAEWRIMRKGNNTWTRSLSPHDFAAAIPATTKVIALTGSRDNNTFPEIARTYIDDLKKRGLDARYIEVSGDSHNSVARSDDFYTAVGALLK